MPTYEYRRADGTTFEISQRISADPLTHDPETGQPVTRVISGGAGLQFKGDGFYLTDYVHPGSADRKAGATADSGGSGESASTSKPASTPATSSSPPAASSTSDD